MTIYERLKELCAKKGISINKLEEMIGVSKGFLCRIDKHKPSSEKIQKLAEILQTSERYILTGEEIIEYTNPYTKEENIHIKNYNSLDAKQQQTIDYLIASFMDLNSDINDYGTPGNVADEYYELLYKFTKPMNIDTFRITRKEYTSCINALNVIEKIPNGINKKIDYLKMNKEYIECSLDNVYFSTEETNANEAIKMSFDLVKKVNNEAYTNQNKSSKSDDFEQELLECLEYIDSKIDHNSKNYSVLLSKKQYVKSLELINQARKYKKGENKLIDLIDQKYHYILDGFEMFVSYESNFFDDETNQN